MGCSRTMTVALSGFQWAIWRIYTTGWSSLPRSRRLLYQDFNEQFEGYTQRSSDWYSARTVALSGFQWAIWRIYTTVAGVLGGCYVLLYQDFNEQFEGYTQHQRKRKKKPRCCFIRISMSNLKDIHNAVCRVCCVLRLLYQDFNEQFEGYTQRCVSRVLCSSRCFIRISMSNLKDIHNSVQFFKYHPTVALSGFQWAIWRIYTTTPRCSTFCFLLLYQDFNEQFEGYTQQVCHWLFLIRCCFIRISMSNLKDIHNAMCASLFYLFVALSGFQWAIWRIYTTEFGKHPTSLRLLYQDFNEQFEGYTQLVDWVILCACGCFIRISMSNLKDIHNGIKEYVRTVHVVLSGFQWTKRDITILILPQNYKKCMKCTNFCENILLFHKKALPLHQQNLKDIHNKDYSVV